jgi:hypothetical protein
MNDEITVNGTVYVKKRKNEQSSVEHHHVFYCAVCGNPAFAPYLLRKVVPSTINGGDYWLTGHPSCLRDWWKQ